MPRWNAAVQRQRKGLTLLGNGFHLVLSYIWEWRIWHREARMRKLLCAICEDEPKVLEYLAQSLRKAFAEHSLTASFMTFSSGEALLAQAQEGRMFDIYFLDIEMPKVNGLYLSRKIRTRDENALIVFISNREELVFQSFKVRPFRFLRKSHFEEELPSVVDALSRELSKADQQSLILHELNSTNVYSVHPREIRYIEARGKKCRVVTNMGEFSLHYRFYDIERQTAGMGFLQPHRSYLVNFDYIFSLGKSTVILDDGTEIPISRRRIQEFRDSFTRMAGMV